MQKELTCPTDCSFVSQYTGSFFLLYFCWIASTICTQFFFQHRILFLSCGEFFQDLNTCVLNGSDVLTGVCNERYERRTLSGLAVFSVTIDARISANCASELWLASLTVSNRVCAYRMHMNSYYRRDIKILTLAPRWDGKLQKTGVHISLRRGRFKSIHRLTVRWPDLIRWDLPVIDERLQYLFYRLRYLK